MPSALCEEKWLKTWLNLLVFVRKAREDIEAKNLKLAQMEADYGDVVPRRDHEKLNEKYQLLEKDIEKIKKDHEQLMNEHRSSDKLETFFSFSSNFQTHPLSSTQFSPNWFKF